jgi:hypothetical protein
MSARRLGLITWFACVAAASPLHAAPKLHALSLKACANVAADLGQPTGAGKGNVDTAFARIRFKLLDPLVGNNAWRGDLGATISFTVSAPSPTAVYTIMNTFYGQGGLANATVTFTGTNGSSASFPLIGNVDIRDYNNWVFTNGINGTSTQTWWSNTPSPVDFDQSHRLDVQRFDLSAAFAGETLTGISIQAPADAQPGYLEPVLFALGIDGEARGKGHCMVH